MLVSEIEMICQGDFALLHNASLGVVQVSDDRPFRVEINVLNTKYQIKSEVNFKVNDPLQWRHISSTVSPNYRWVHMAQFCEWEWKSSEEGTVVTGCTMHGVSFKTS